MNKKLLLPPIIACIVLCGMFVPVFAYEQHDPLLIENVHATAENPYVIEGMDITCDEGSGLIVRNSSHILIRNNYFHDCAKETGNSPEGLRQFYSLYVDSSDHIEISQNTFENNLIGPYIRKSHNVTILNNSITNSTYFSGIRCDHCTNSEIAYNTLEDNGVREWFFIDGGSGPRIIGIWAVRPENMKIHHNTVINSTSDGISVTGQDYLNDDWKGIAQNVEIYNNTLMNNLEQGIWVCRARNITIHDNEIHASCDSPGVGTGIFFEFDVQDSEVYDNVIHACKQPCGVGLRFSHNNYIHDNLLYTFEKAEFIDRHGEDLSDGREKARKSGIALKKSSGNVEENNTVIVENGPKTTELLVLSAIILIVLVGGITLWNRKR